MQRTNVLELVVGKEEKKLLSEMMVLSSCVWNMANYNFRQAIFKKEKINSFFKQQQAIQKSDDYQRLGRSYALPMLQKHSFIVKTYFGLIKSNTQEGVGLPKYYKNRKTKTTIPSILRVDSKQYRIENDKVFLPLSRVLRKETQRKGVVLEYKGEPRWSGKQLQCEIRYDNVKKKFYIYQSLEVADVTPKERINKTLSLDIGIKRGITSFDGSKAILFNNPNIKRWKKMTARINRLQKIAKNRNGMYTTKQIQSLYSRRKSIVDNYYKDIVSWLINDANPDKIVVGDVKGILFNKSKGKNSNQMTHNLWSFGLLYKRLENKCEEKGIQLVKVPEPYTTKTCPACGNKNKPRDRAYSCECGYKQDRDVNGAINIYKNNINQDVYLHPTVESYRLLIGGKYDQ